MRMLGVKSIRIIMTLVIFSLHRREEVGAHVLVPLLRTCAPVLKVSNGKVHSAKMSPRYDKRTLRNWSRKRAPRGGLAPLRSEMRMSQPNRKKRRNGTR